MSSVTKSARRAPLACARWASRANTACARRRRFSSSGAPATSVVSRSASPRSVACSRQRNGVVQRLLGGGEHTLQGVGEHGAGKGASGGKVPVQGRVAHPGVARDVIEGRVESTLAIDGPGGVDQRLPVARGVDAQPGFTAEGLRHIASVPGRGDNSPVLLACAYPWSAPRKVFDVEVAE